jgi:hypothetical protein
LTCILYCLLIDNPSRTASLAHLERHISIHYCLSTFLIFYYHSPTTFFEPLQSVSVIRLCSLRLLQSKTNKNQQYAANMKLTSAVVLTILAFTATAFADAEPVAGGKFGKTRCGFPGSTCARDAVAEPVAEAEADAKRMKFNKGLCGFPGSTCSKKRDAEANAEAEAEAKRMKFNKGLCGFPGSTCSKKREAEAMAVAVAEAEAEAKRMKFNKGLCGFPGSTCSKAKREAEAEAEADAKLMKFHKGLCGFPGSTCHKAKRDAEAGGKFGKTRCGFPGSTCARAVTREAEAQADEE